MRKQGWAVVLGVVLATAGCQQLNSRDSGTDDSTDSDIVVSSTMHAGEMVTSAARELLAGIRTTACSSIAFGSCTDQTRTRYFSLSGGDSGGCLWGTEGTASARTVYGSALLTFSSSICAMTNGNTATRTLSNHYIVQPSGRKVLEYTGAGTVAGVVLSSSDLVDYGGTSRSGGSVYTSTGATSRTLSVSGLHRRALLSTGGFGFWHTIYTSTPLSMTLAGRSATVTTGTVVVQANLAEITATTEFSGVVYSSDCCYPTSGTLTTTMTSASESSTLTTVFSSTCGSATVGGVDTTLPACQD